MMKNPLPHFRAVFQSLLVTFLWSTSLVLIKIGLKDIPTRLATNIFFKFSY